MHAEPVSTCSETSYKLNERCHVSRRECGWDLKATANSPWVSHINASCWRRRRASQVTRGCASLKQGEGVRHGASVRKPSNSQIEVRTARALAKVLGRTSKARLDLNTCELLLVLKPKGSSGLRQHGIKNACRNLPQTLKGIHSDCYSYLASVLTFVRLPIGAPKRAQNMLR